MLKNLKLLSRIYRGIRLLFHFQAPRLEQLNYLDVVVTQKPLLLVSWNSKYHYLIKIPVVKKRYHTRSGSVLIKLPTGLGSIEILVWSLWRKRTYVLPINSFAIDPRAFEQYINSYNILDSSILHNFEFKVSTAFSIRLPGVSTCKSEAKITIPSMRVSIPTFQQTKSSTNAQ